jgi:hypothetical protein
MHGRVGRGDEGEKKGRRLAPLAAASVWNDPD